MLRTLLLCLFFFSLASAWEDENSTFPPPERHHQDVLTKADITMAVMDGLGGVVDNFAHRLEDDWDRILTRLPGMTPPAEADWEEVEDPDAQWEQPH